MSRLNFHLHLVFSKLRRRCNRDEAWLLLNVIVSATFLMDDIIHWQWKSGFLFSHKGLHYSYSPTEMKPSLVAANEKLRPDGGRWKLVLSHLPFLLFLLFPPVNILLLFYDCCIKFHLVSFYLKQWHGLGFYFKFIRIIRRQRYKATFTPCIKSCNNHSKLRH